MKRVALLLLACVLFACDQVATEDVVGRTKRQWQAQGWTFVETVGTEKMDAQPLTQWSIPTASTATATATTPGGPVTKQYPQTKATYLIVTMGKDPGNTFCLVFSKPK